MPKGGMKDVQHQQNKQFHWFKLKISTDPTGKVLGCTVAIPLMTLKCSRVDVFAAFLALNHFVRLLMTFQLTFVISCKAAAITTAGSTLATCPTWPNLVSFLLGFL